MSDQNTPKRIPSIHASHRPLIPDLESEETESEEVAGDTSVSEPEEASEREAPDSDLVELEPIGAAPRSSDSEEATRKTAAKGTGAGETETVAASSELVTENLGVDTGPRELYRALGLALVSAGISLAVAPFVSWKAAQILGPVGNPLIPAGTLMVAGLVLFGVGVVRRALNSIRAEVAYIASEAPRLEQIASHGRELQREFSDVESSLGASRADVQTLRELVEKLMQLATNPEFEVSLFRMAASLDQLGARLDVSMKERFGSMDESIESIKQTQVTSTGELTSELKSLDTRLSERDSGQLEAQRETHAQIEASAADLRERLDQGHAAIERLATQSEQQAGHLEGALSGDLRQQLEELRERVDQNLESTANDTRTRIEAVTGAVEGLGGELSGAFGQLERNLSSETEQRLNDLHEQLRAEAQAATLHSGEQLENCLESLASMGTDLERVQSAVTAGMAGLSEEAGRAAREVAEGLELLNNELNQAVVHQSTSITSQVENLGTQLSERADEQASELRDQEAVREACSQRQHQAFEGVVAEHQVQLEQTFTQRCDALESELAALLELIAEGPVNAAAPTPEVVAEVASEESFTEFCTKVQAQSVEQFSPAPDTAPAAPAAPFGASLPFGHDVPLKAETSADSSEEPEIPGPLPARNAPRADEPKAESKSFNYPIERLGNEFDDGWIDG